MTEGRQALIRYRLDRAAETLEEARLMLQTHHRHGAANRLYYACFYAVTALLLKHDLSRAKHSGVLALFNQHFIKSGRIPLEMGKFYARVYENRMESDYADTVALDLSSVEDDLAQAQSFIRLIAALIDQA